MRSKLRLRIVLPLAALVLAGLGAGYLALSGPPDAEAVAPLKRPAAPAAAKAPSLKEWAKQANAVCKRTNEELTALGEPYTLAELVPYAPQLVELVKAEAKALAEVGLPATNAPLAKRLVALDGKAVKSLSRLTAGLGAGDSLEVRAALGSFGRIASVRNEVARDLGARVCAKDVYAKPAGSSAAALDRELQAYPAVVVVFYSPGSPVDGLATREARAGAAEAGAGFVAVDVTNEDDVATLSGRYAVRAAPSVLIVVPLQGAVTRIDGFADRSTVAQAAENAVS